MPTYNYKCEKNPKHVYSENRGMNEPDKVSTCAEKDCDGKLIRVFGAPPIMFKGTGFSSNRG